MFTRVECLASTMVLVTRSSGSVYLTKSCERVRHYFERYCTTVCHGISVIYHSSICTYMYVCKLIVPVLSVRDVCTVIRHYTDIDIYSGLGKRKISIFYSAETAICALISGYARFIPKI